MAGTDTVKLNVKLTTPALRSDGAERANPRARKRREGPRGGAHVPFALSFE